MTDLKISMLGAVLAFVMAPAAYAAPTTLVYCAEGSPRTFNPQMGTDGPTFNASSRPTYNRLVDFEKGGTKQIPLGIPNTEEHRTSGRQAVSASQMSSYRPRPPTAQVRRVTTTASRCPRSHSE